MAVSGRPLSPGGFNDQSEITFKAAWRDESGKKTRKKVRSSQQMDLSPVKTRTEQRSRRISRKKELSARASHYKCDKCGESFKDKATLTRHQLVHTGAKPHKCNECGKCFSRKDNLTGHQLIHDGEKPHKCHECGKCFKHRSALSRHQLVVHTGEKPHKRDGCGKRLAKKSHLCNARVCFKYSAL